MEKKLLLKAEVRREVGSSSALKVRKSGRVPATVYGHGQKAVSVSLDSHNLTEGLHHGSRVVDIQIGASKETVLLKDLQYDYLGKNIIHVDLMRVDVSESVKVLVPIELKGTAKGTHEGGIIEEHADSLEIECKVNEIPEVLIISVKDMEIGDSIHAGQVVLPAGVKLVSNPDLLLVTCSLVAAAKSTEELEEETPAAPEVIAGAKEEEQQAEEDKQEKTE